jgi:hypothetical protein
MSLFGWYDDDDEMAKGLGCRERRDVILALNGNLDIPGHQASPDFHSDKPIRGSITHSSRTLETQWQTQPLSGSSRFDLEQAIRTYDTSFTTFTHLYRIFVLHHSHPSTSVLKHKPSFVPELEHVYTSYTATLQSFLHLVLLEQQAWDPKSACLGVEEIFTAYLDLLTSEFGGTRGWGFDPHAETPSMEGYYVHLEQRFLLSQTVPLIQLSDEMEEESDADDPYTEDVSADKPRAREGIRKNIPTGRTRKRPVLRARGSSSDPSRAGVRKSRQ